MATHRVMPADGWVTIPEGDWPPAIASLRPFQVTVFEWGVDISTKPYFDGGWGYQVLRDGKNLPMPAGCYSEPGPAVFWHGPC